MQVLSKKENPHLLRCGFSRFDAEERIEAISADRN
jgi:hypothetical protein